LPLGVFYHKDLSSEIYRKSEQELLELAKKYYIALIFKKENNKLYVDVYRESAFEKKTEIEDFLIYFSDSSDELKPIQTRDNDFLINISKVV